MVESYDPEKHGYDIDNHIYEQVWKNFPRKLMIAILVFAPLIVFILRKDDIKKIIKEHGIQNIKRLCEKHYSKLCPQETVDNCIKVLSNEGK